MAMVEELWWRVWKRVDSGCCWVAGCAAEWAPVMVSPAAPPAALGTCPSAYSRAAMERLIDGGGAQRCEG